MAKRRMTHNSVEALLATFLLIVPIVFSDDNDPIPSDKTQINNWFNKNVKPVGDRKGSLDPALETAEARSKVVNLKADGTGDFKTITDAINSIPTGNTQRVILSLGGGNYTEKITIDRNRPFITFYGAPNDIPTLVFDGTAAKYGTVDSATLIVESDYFSAVNVHFVNSSPKPDGKRKGAQALALRIGGDKASFYNCKIFGFQDTVCDDKGKHFYKDCYIEGTVDFIFGDAKSLYVNTETRVLPGEPMAMVTAQARKSDSSDTGYSFVHCSVTGSGGTAFLGRAWMQYAKVVYAYTDISNVIKPEGWSDNRNPENDKTVFFGEYKNMGAGADTSKRVAFAKKLTDADVNPFITLAFIEGSKWLLPPAAV